MFVAETMIRHIAEYLDKDVVSLSQLNLYKEGDLTHYNQKLDYCTLERCWNECLSSSNYQERKHEIQIFNEYVCLVVFRFACDVLIGIIAIKNAV